MSKEIKVGLLVVIAGTILYMGFSFLKGKDFFSTSNKYYVQYGNVSGLTVSNPVIVNGFTVGRVDAMDILHDKGDSVLVLFSVKEDLPINNKTIAELISTDVLGGKAINLILGNGKTILENEDYVIGRLEQSILADLQKKAMPIISNADTLVERFKDYMNGEGDKNIDLLMKTIQNVASNTDKTITMVNTLVNKNDNSFSETSQNLKLLSQELIKVSKELSPIMNNAKGFTDSLNSLQLNQTIASANASLGKINELMTSINKQDGSLGKLLNSDETHTNLNATIKDLDFLVNDMQANPKRYIQFSVIGGTPKDERAIIKNTNDGEITNQIIVELKREAPNTMVAILLNKTRLLCKFYPKD